jgi:hypothetical protein
VRTLRRASGAIALAAAACASAARGLPVVSVDLDRSLPGVQAQRSAVVGEVLAIEVAVSGVEDPGLNAFQLDLGFDPTRVALLAAQAGDALAPVVEPAFVDLSGPAASLAFFTVGPGARAGGGALAILELRALAEGPVAFALSDVILSAPFGAAIPTGGLAGATLTIVPEPASDGLLAGGLLALAARRRRQTSRWLRSIQAFFSWTSRRRTARSTVASSPRRSAAASTARAARTIFA